MIGDRHSAVIFKKKDGTYGIIIRKEKPMPPDGEPIIEMLHRKDNESFDDFKERVIRFVKEECK